MVASLERALVIAVFLTACGGRSEGSPSEPGDGLDAGVTDGGSDAGPDGTLGSDSGPAGDDAGADAAPPDCTYDDGGAVLDASARFRGSCDGGCPAGTICAVEIGGVAGGGGEYCAPIVDRCRNDVSCACLASCACGTSYGRAERCSDGVPKGTVLDCDNGVR